MEHTYDGRRRRERPASLTGEEIRSWRDNVPAAGAQQTAFLGDHPRSGTTLLEQLLGTHPERTPERLLEMRGRYLTSLPEKLARCCAAFGYPG